MSQRIWISRAISSETSRDQCSSVLKATTRIGSLNCPDKVLVSTRLLSGVRLVRAFSAVDATAIEASAAGRGQRLAVPIASDDQEALQVAEQLVRDAGCDPVAVDGFTAARRFQRGGAGFRAHLGEA